MKPSAFSHEALVPTGITLLKRIENHLLVAKATLLEIYEILQNGEQLRFVTSQAYQDRILFIDMFNQFIIVGFPQYLLQLDAALNQVKLYDSMPRSEQMTDAQVQYCYCKTTSIVVAASEHNTLTFIHLKLQKTQSIAFRSGKIVSVAAQQDTFAVLAQTTAVDPGTVLSSFKNLRSAYLALFSTHNNHVTETQKLTQLPYDSYRVVDVSAGFVVLSPRQFIFKRLRATDLRFRFAKHPEECDADYAALKRYLEAFAPVDFDFSGLLQNKVYTALVDTVSKEQELLQTIDQSQLPIPPPAVVPGFPALQQSDLMRYYGYSSAEINLKQRQVFDCVGDYPVFDYTLEAEIGGIGAKYVGPLAILQNYYEIPPVYCAVLCEISPALYIVIAGNGTQYSLHLGEQPRMLPIISANPQQSLWIEHQVGQVAYLGNNQALDHFTAHKTISHNVMLGSAVSDSFIFAYQESAAMPPTGFYYDYREKGVVKDTDFRAQLFSEMKKNVEQVEIKPERVNEVEEEEDELEEVDFCGTKITISKKAMHNIFNFKPAPFQPSNILKLGKTSKGDKYDQITHLITKPINILPSLAGVVDATPQQRRYTSSVNNSICLLHHGGCIQKVQQSVSADNSTMIPFAGQDQVSTVHVIQDYQNESYIMVVEKKGSQVLKLTNKNNKLEVQDKNEFSDMNTSKFVLATKTQNGQTIIVTHEELKIYPKNTKKPNVYSFDKENKTVSVGLCADIVGDIVAVAFDEFVCLYFIKNGTLDFSYVVVLDRYAAIDKLDIITSVSLNRPETEALKHLGFDDSKYPASFNVVLSSSEIFLFGVTRNCETELIYVLSPFEKQVDKNYFGDMQIINADEDLDANRKKLVPTLQQIEAADLGLCVSQVMFHSAKVECSDQQNVYLFASLKGGGIVIYQVIKFMNTRKLKMVKNLSQYLYRTKILEDRFAFCLKQNRQNADYRLLPQKPFRIFTQENVECVFIGYPPPSHQSEPVAFVVVPTLQGALSFYQFGRQPSVISTNGQQMTATLQNNFPPRDLIQTNVGLIVLAEAFSLAVKEITKEQVARIGKLHLFKQINFGQIKSVLEHPLSKFQLTFPKHPQLKYLASMAQNQQNVYRQQLHLPFTCSRFVFHYTSNTFVVVSSVQRYEVRPFHSITKDEVANIRVFENVEAQDLGTISDEEKAKLIKSSHQLLPRDPPPFNSHSTIQHEHLFLVDNNSILDHQSLELNRTEHVNCILSDSIHSLMPLCFGKFWQGAYRAVDEFGRVDRRRKNDDRKKRDDILNMYEKREEARELIFTATGYLIGGFNKQYGKIGALAIEQINDVYIDTIKKQLAVIAEQDGADKPRTQLIGSRVPSGQLKFALNRITQEEIQNGATALQVHQKSKCLLVAESKQINGYLLTDGQKFEKCEMTFGFGYVTELKRFQDWLLITDAVNDSKLTVFREKGKRLSEMSALSRECHPLASEFIVNQFTAEMQVVFAFKRQLAIFGYDYEEYAVIKREHMELAQVIQYGQTAIKMVKIPSAQPVPTQLDSGVCTLIISTEGGVTQLVPAPIEFLQVVGYAKAVLKCRSLVYFDFDQRQGVFLTNEWRNVQQVDAINLVGKALAGKGAW